jgi:hypothetical protein
MREVMIGNNIVIDRNLCDQFFQEFIIIYLLFKVCIFF